MRAKAARTAPTASGVAARPRVQRIPAAKPGNAIAPRGGIVVQPEAERGFSEHVQDVVLGCCAWK